MFTFILLTAAILNIITVIAMVIGSCLDVRSLAKELSSSEVADMLDPSK